jgi:hypothetical protein
VVLRVGDQDAPKTAAIGGGRLLVELELVHPLEVEGQRALAAVDLEAVVVLAPRGEPGPLDGAQGAAGEAHQGDGGVIHGDAAGARRIVRQRPLLDEGLEIARDLDDLAHQEAGQVQGVGGDVAQRPRARLLLAKPPQQRQLGAHHPVLQVGAAVVVDLAQVADLDDSLGQHHRRDAAVVVAEHVHHAGFLHRRQHRLGFGHRVGQGLLAQNRLAGLGGGDGDLGVAVTRGADVHQVDVVAPHDLAPVGGGLLPAEARRRLRHRRGVPSAQHLHAWREPRRHERPHLAVGVAMGPAHELVADEGDVELLHGLAPLR